MAILNRRGNESDFDATKMLPGEWAVSLDTRYVRMCFAPGICLRMATYEAFENDMEEIKDILSKSQNIQQVVTAINANVNSKAEIVVERTAEAEKYRDEAKMYAENASAVSGVEIATKERAGIIKGGDNYISPDGTLQLITTTSSTTLPNSHAGRLKFNEIVGGMEQDSTEGNQLFDILAGVANAEFFDNTGALQKSSNTKVLYIPCAANETYTVNVMEISNADTNTYFRVAYVTEDKAFISRPPIITGVESKSYTTSDNCAFLQIAYDIGVEKVMLNAGSEAFPWEPFTNGASPNPSYPQPINGSVIETVRVHGEQLFDASATPYTKKHDYSFDKESGNYSFTASTAFLMNRWRIKVKPNADITITAKEISPSVIVQISNTSLDGTIDIRLNSGTLKKTFSSLDFTELSVSIFVNTDSSGTVVANGIMVSYNADVTYEPYQGKEIALSQPITLYNDVMSAKEIERKYKAVVYDGNETSWLREVTSTGFVRFYRRISNAMNISTRTKIFVSHFHFSETGSEDEYGVYVFANGKIHFYMNLETVEEWQEWLSNNNVEVVYPLAESVIETLPTADQIALNSLPTYDGITYVEFIDVGVQPSVSIDYGTSKIGGMTIEGLLAGINGELQSQLNNDRITALESAVVNNV